MSLMETTPTRVPSWSTTGNRHQNGARSPVEGQTLALFIYHGQASNFVPMDKPGRLGDVLEGVNGENFLGHHVGDGQLAGKVILDFLSILSTLFGRFRLESCLLQRGGQGFAPPQGNEHHFDVAYGDDTD